MRHGAFLIIFNYVAYIFCFELTVLCNYVYMTECSILFSVFEVDNSVYVPINSC